MDIKFNLTRQYTLRLLISNKTIRFWLVILLIVPAVSIAQVVDNDRVDALKNLEQTQQREKNFLKDLEKQKEQKLREKKNISVEIVTNRSPAKTTKGDKDICFNTLSLHLSGATILKGKEWNTISKKYIGLCIGITQVNELIRQVTNFYIDKGYLTSRAIIPEQDLKSGKLEVLVIEGVVEDIILNENNIRDRATVAMVFPSVKGKILNLRDIEQGLDQINRLSSSTATMQLLPGQQQGGTKIVITNKLNKPNRVSIGYDNSGQISTGKNKATASLERDNLLGLGEGWSFHFNEDTSEHSGSRSSQVYSGSISLPFGYWTLSQNVSHSEYLQTITGSNQTFKASGETDNGTSKIERVAFRNQNSKLLLYSALKLKNTKAFIEDVASTSGTYGLSIASMGADYTLRVLDAVWNFASAYERGLQAFGARNDTLNITSDSPHAQFNKYTVDASIYKPFNISTLNLAFRSNISGQYSKDTLYSSERISIGDRYTVRGFQENSLIGDSGLYNRNELMWNVPQFVNNKYINSLISLQPYVGLDIGKVIADSNFGTGVLSGWATGIRNNSEYLGFDLAYAEKLKAPNSLIVKDQEVYFMAVVRVGF